MGVITIALLSRYLGVDAFGQYNYIFAFYYFFVVINDLGIDVIVVREASRNPSHAEKIIGTMRTFKLLIAIVSLFAAWGIIHRMNFPEPLNLSLKIYALILPLSAFQLSGSIFQSKQNWNIPPSSDF